MTIVLKNKYVRRAHISEYTFRQLVKCFAEDLSATEIAQKIAINRNTVNRYINQIRNKIVEFCEQQAPFSAVREPVANLPTRIFANLGLLKRRGKVYATMLANSTLTKFKSLINTQKEQDQSLTIHAIEVEEEYGLIAVGYDSNPQYAAKPSYVDDLRCFWHYVQQRLAKFHGIAKHKLYSHLKETEFRFNFRNDDLYLLILQLLKASPLE